MTVSSTHISVGHSGPIVRSAHFGGCWDGNLTSAVQCTLDPSQCSDASKLFVSGNDHAKAVIHDDMRCQAYDLPAGKCFQSTYTVGACVVGGCGKSSDIVEATAVDDCNLVYDGSTNAATLYGGCVDKLSKQFKGCFWSSDDCVGSQTYGESWMVPDEIVSFLQSHDSNHGKEFCDCSDVRIGACFDPKTLSMVCAIDGNQCGSTEEFVSARTIIESPDMFGNKIDCRLCDPETDVTTEMIDATLYLLHPTEAPTMSPTEAPEISETAMELPVKYVIGIMAGSIVGTIFLLAIIVLLAYRCCDSGRGVTYYDGDAGMSSKDVEGGQDQRQQQQDITTAEDDDLADDNDLSDLPPAAKTGEMS